jgi:thiamine-monophosphate kinase
MLEDLNRNLTPIEKLGEFGLIEEIKQQVNVHHSTTVKGIGDDCAVIGSAAEKWVLSSDVLIEGIHFDLSYVPLKHLGYKSVIVNISDVCAMNVVPTHLILNIAISSRFPLEAVQEFYSGVHLACEKYNIELVGGDTSTSEKGFFISGTAMGIGNPDEIVYRSGAGDKDLICVTGDLGAAYAGLQLLEREKRVFIENPNIQPDLSGNDYILERQLKPEARLDMIRKFKQIGIVPTSMIDISDGLASEVLHLCKASDKGCVIYMHKIPVDVATSVFLEEMKIFPTIGALNGGEDYELLFTVNQRDFEKLQELGDVRIIGYITDKTLGCKIETEDGRSSDLESSGWNAFAHR